MIDTLKEPAAELIHERTAAAPTADAERVKSMLAAFARTDSADHPAWLRAIREEARTRAAHLGFPTTRHEEYKYTNLTPILQLPLHAAEKPKASLTAKDIEKFGHGLDCYQLVFVDGHYSAELSKLPGAGNDLKLGTLKSNSSEIEKHLAQHADVDANFFTAVNTAYFQDGAFVFLGAGKTADKPVHLLFVGASTQAGAATFPRVLIVAQRAAQMKVIESHVSLADAARVNFAVTELVLAADAQVEHCKLQQDSEQAFHIATVQAVQEKGSLWTSHSIATGSKTARNQVQTLFDEEGGSAILNGLYLGHGEQLIDHHTVVDHAKPHCESHEFYHGILADRSRGVFNGKIFVRKDAQKTNAKQTNRNLLLSDNASIDTKPQLEIYADDVKCTHGAAIGQLNEEAIFYLRARGIGEDLARKMLIQAFAADVVERISIEPVRAELERMLMERFATAAK
jgi:Fe-S cluster assembly protein SufD